MLPYDYGTLYSLNTSDPWNTDVYLSWLGSGTNAINRLATFPGTFLPSNYFTTDTSLVQEVTYLQGGYLWVNWVTGSTAVYLKDQIETTIDSRYTFIGTKKVSDTVYNTYCMATHTSTATDIVYDFRRIVSTSGASSTDSSITDLHIAIESGAEYSQVFTRIGRKLYVSLIYNSDSDLSLAGWECRLYSLDMETESIEEVSSLSLPPIPNGNYGGTNGVANFHGVLEQQGEIRWWIDYREDVVDIIFPFTSHVSYKIYYNGSTLNYLNLNPFDPGLITSPLNRNAYRYNYRDTTIIRSFTYDTTTYYITIDSVAGVNVATDDSTFPDSVPVKIISKSAYPKIGTVSSVYHWLDANGKSLGAITIPGVTSIHSIYPTLDTINGSLYMSARMDDGTDKLISVDSSTHGLLNVYDLPAFPFTNAPNSIANHGNFFIHTGGTFPSLRLYITYLVDVPPITNANDVMMIVEMN